VLRVAHTRSLQYLGTSSSYTKPIGADVICPRDFEKGAAYVDTLSGADNVGKANALLSYSWGNRVFDIADALKSWAETHGRKPQRTYAAPATDTVLSCLKSPLSLCA
jgi:hypothetical protein